jgi:threonine/homoserine/homoserine lactone efflux protein
MLAVVGILSALSGAVLACTSRRFPGYVRAIEIGAGVLLICGLALASCALPVIL